MSSPESFHPLPTELPAPPRERLRNSLIVDPYRSIQRGVESIYEETAEAFEREVGALPRYDESIIAMYRSQLAENFTTLLAEISAECELRLQDFDSKPENVTPEQLESWFSGVVLKAAEVRDAYLARAKTMASSALMPLSLFRVHMEAPAGNNDESQTPYV